MSQVDGSSDLVYVFDPTTEVEQQPWSIVLATPEAAEQRSPTPPEEPTTLDLADSSPPWTQLVKQVLTADYRLQLIATLRDFSPLPDLITEQLFRHLLKVYRFKLEQAIRRQGVDSIDTRLPHFKVVSDRKTHTKTLELNLDEERIRAYLKRSLSNLFSQAEFWEEFANVIGTNLVVWAIDQVEKTTPTEDIPLAVQQLLQNATTPKLQEKISFYGQIYCQDITQKIIDGFRLPTCSLQDIEKILGLKQPPPASAEASFMLDTVAVIPTAIPIASSIRAQLRPDLWQRNSDELAVFRYRSRTNPNNYIEHYITNPGDIDLLPWEAAGQIIDKFGFDTVKLQMIFAARTMEEDEPWNTTFTLRATDIIPLLGWDRNHSISTPEKRNSVASAAYALSCLLVKSVWIEGRGPRKVDASTPIGRMWDVLIDPHGQIDWVTGKIERPEEVYITVSPGLWTKHFLNRAGSKAKEALHQFGYLASNILRIDPYHHEIALRLAIQLTLDARVRARNDNPYDYRVGTLLEEVLPKAEIDKALLDKHRARDLKNRWNNALQLLTKLGWQIEFDPETYPDWLQPNSKAEKPSDWRKIKIIERLLQAKLTIKPPHPIPGLLSQMRNLKKSKAIAPAKVAEELTGDQVKEGRLKLGWNRKELGGFLGLSADYVGKLERGDRPITPDLEPRLRKLLHL